MIPQEKTAAVTCGLLEAFGVAEFEDIDLMIKGTAGLAFRIVVGGVPYLLKINTRTRMIGPARQFACMQAAAEVGLAPHVRYTSIEDEISITDFVEEQPFRLLRLLFECQRFCGLFMLCRRFPPSRIIRNMQDVLK